MKRIKQLYNCIMGRHIWCYLYGNYHTNKDVFKCNYCGKRKEE